MTIEIREEEFRQGVTSQISETPHISPCYGTSNIARMIPGGIILGVSNLDRLSDSVSYIAFLSRFCPLPNIEIYIAGVLESGTTKLRERLKYMLEKCASGDTRFGERNNNTAICIGPDATLYAYNKKISELSTPSQDYLGEPITISNIYYSIYCATPSPADRAVIRHLLEGMAVFLGKNNMTELPVWGKYDLLERSTSAPGEGLANIVTRCHSDLMAANFIVQKPVVLRLIASLLSKQFVIITGLSGSGKTKLAHTFVNWISNQDQFGIVAVGADWTSNENILGYQDALQTTIFRKPSSGALDLILKAEKNPGKPYFLILDEMNLSHVERYFADILSSMESGTEISLHQANVSLESFPGDTLPVPPKLLKLPENLFIIGTVNIDETTYMFSPKVLDRANVIEFRASAIEISSFLDSPARVDMAALAGRGSDFGHAFVSSCKENRSLSTIPPDIGDGPLLAKNLKERITELFVELAPVGAEFGFRTALEISRFFYHHAVLSGIPWNFNDALDAQVIQKLMPKLHGSDRKLRPTLIKIKSFCETHDLKISLEKINRMLDRLGKDGFTSFAEA